MKTLTEEGGIAWQEIGYEAHDARDGNITDKITITGTVDENVTGDYILTYLVSDAAGNEANTTRKITIVDTTAPVITLNGDVNITHEAGSAYHDANATWTDAVDGSGSYPALG